MTKRFVLQRNNGTEFFCKNMTTKGETGTWTNQLRDATLFTDAEAAIWSRCFAGSGPEMVEYSPCAVGHDFSEVELDSWDQSSLRDSELNVALVITCRDCGQTACVSTSVDVEPRDWS